MSKQPLVSIICTVRDGARYLGGTIESVLDQSYENTEFVIVDDGSRDDTASIVAQFARRDPRVRLVTTDGVGRGVALNLAIRHSEGSLLANIDADDPCHPERVRMQVKAMTETPDLGVLGTDVRYVGPDRDPEWVDVVDVRRTVRPMDITSRIAIRNPLSHSSVMMRRELIERLGGYDPNRKSQFDYDLWIRVVRDGSKLGRLPVVLSSKRLHAGQRFERRQPFQYRLRSLALQARAIHVTGRYPFLLLIPLRLVWGAMPLRARTWLHRGNRWRS